MKKILTILSMFAALAVTSCSQSEEVFTPSTEREPITIGISTVGVSYEDLPGSRAGATADLLAAQIYEVNGDVATPYAKGLFEDWSALSFEGYSNTTYAIVATMVVDGGNVLSMGADMAYGKPFESAVSTAFEYSSVAFAGLASSTATLLDGAEYLVPNIDRYYGSAESKVTKENPTITTYLKRMSFGVKADGTNDDVTLKIAGAPEVTLSSGDMEIFSLEDFEAAYIADEASANYSETKSVEIARNGNTLKSVDVIFFRNKLATLSIDKSTGELGFDFEAPFEGVIKVLTFEDEDYTAGDNYIGGSDWSSLIDVEYDGSMLYSSTTQYTWTDTNNTYLNGVVNEGVDWNTYEPDWKFWTGGIAISNYYMPVVSGTEVSYMNQLSVSNGEVGAAGNNGSANFAIVFDGAGGGMGMPTYLSFGDATARVIDHLYISSTSYLESVAIDGNSLSPAIDADGYYTVTAVGYDAEENETGTSVAYEFMQDGKFTTGWHKWNLNELGKVAKVRFKITSSASNDYGMSAPAYFAIDDIAVVM